MSDEYIVPPYDVYPEKNFKLDIANGQWEIDLTVKTWGDNYTSKPVVLVFTKEVAMDFLRRFQKAVDGLS